MELKELRNIHAGETAWVFGSGGTMNFLDPKFFDGKLVVSANMGAYYFGLTPNYVFTHHHTNINEYAVKLPETFFVVNRWETPVFTEYVNPLANVIVHEQKHKENSFSGFNPYERDQPEHEDQLVFGSTSVHGAIHLGAYMGALDIVLVGIDCGVLDDAVNVDEYPQPTQLSFQVWNQHLALMRDWLRDTYGARIYSLNPFVNLHLEGHKIGGI